MELKERISEGIVEGAKQQAANLLASVKKEKMLELAVEKVEEAAFSPEITWFLDPESQVRLALSIICFMCFAFFLGLTLRLLEEAARRRARRA